MWYFNTFEIGLKIFERINCENILTIFACKEGEHKGEAIVFFLAEKFMDMMMTILMMMNKPGNDDDDDEPVGLAGPVFGNDNDNDNDKDDDDDDDDKPIGLAGPVLGKGSIEAKIPVLPPVRVPHLPSC